MKNIEGNILLINYKYDPISWLIRLYTKSEWNHCAWILNKNQLIESKSCGIIISSINKYDNPKLYKTKILKIKNLTDNDKRYLETYLWYSVTGKTSYFKHVLSFLLIFLQFKRKLPKNTCSGLLAHSFAIINRFFCLKHLNLITPEDINQSNEVEDVNA